MELGQLASFVAVIRTGTVTEAALRRGLAPSSLSAQIRALEKSLGVTVFDRTARGMRPNDAGRRLLPWAERLLDQAEQARHDVTEARPQVRFGALETLAAVQVPAILARLARRHPELVVDVRPLADRTRLLAGVRDGELDAGLLWDTGNAVGDLGFPSPAGLDFLDVDSVALVVVAAADHPLAARKRLSLAEVAGHQLLVSPPGCSFRLVADTLFGTAGPRTELAGITVVRAWAGQGLGVALLPEFAITPETPARRLDLAAPLPRLALRLVWRGDREDRPDLRRLLYAASA